MIVSSKFILNVASLQKLWNSETREKKENFYLQSKNIIKFAFSILKKFSRIHLHTYTAKVVCLNTKYKWSESRESSIRRAAEIAQICKQKIYTKYIFFFKMNIKKKFEKKQKRTR